jgi:hypothetical protein
MGTTWTNAMDWTFTSTRRVLGLLIGVTLAVLVAAWLVPTAAAPAESPVRCSNGAVVVGVPCWTAAGSGLDA